MADGAVTSAIARARPRTVSFSSGHATVLIELDGVRLLTDPLLRGRVAHLRRQVPPVAGAFTAGLDAVLISHLHHDHLDLASLRLLGLDTPLLVPAGAGAWLRAAGIHDVTELRVGEVANVGALAVTAVEARHDGRRRRAGGLRAETLGYLVSGRRKVYFAGDTELLRRHVRLSRALDVALLPVAGWGPTLGPGHMDPLDAARAAASAAAAHRDSDALGNAAADRPRASPPGTARRSAASVRRARRIAGPERRGAGPGAGRGDDALNASSV